MSKHSPLPPAKLHAFFDPERIPWENSDGIPRRGISDSANRQTQPRAMQALDLALNIDNHGYNVFISGSSNLGRGYMLKQYLRPRAKKAPTPPDLIYVNNFVDQDKPCIIALPAGQGKKVKSALSEALNEVRKVLPSRFEADAYVKQRGRLMDKFQNIRSRVLKKMDSAAEGKGFNLDVDESGGLTLYPMLEGKRLSEDEFERLESPLRKELKRKGDDLLRAMAGLIRQLSRAEQDLRTDERSLEREVVKQVLEEFFMPMAEEVMRNCKVERLADFFRDLSVDILENIDSLVPREPIMSGNTPPGMLPETHLPAPEPDFSRYDINVFVDNSADKGAPIIIDDHPTAANLLGCVERESEMGALITDFTLIKAGSLHKANGGFLVLHIEDVLQYPMAWEGLLRALRSGMARLEDPSDGQESSSRTKGIEPEPLALKLKVLLIGPEDLYETLLINDDRFSKLFKIKAHMAEAMDRNSAGVKVYLGRIATIIDESSLLPFDRKALAWLVDYGSRIIEDQRKLSLKFPHLRDLMIEANAIARMEKAEIITGEIMDKTLASRIYRANLVEEIFMEEYDRELIKVRTNGTAIGQVNGLSVTWHGNFEFGLPHQISCTVGVGQGGIIDLEREAELGGPIHTKAMMILKSYLVDQFAYNKPLILTGSLCFEQNYAGIEGDSASGAELAALLSAIAKVPLRLDLAFTGAISQSGQIMAVGGVTPKIEGFFNVCARHGLTRTQGVIIPHDNVDHLMLSPRILEAVDKGEFFIYPVKNIEEAMVLLTGMPAGRSLKGGGFTQGSLYGLVDKNLRDLGELAANAYKKRSRK